MRKHGYQIWMRWNVTQLPVNCTEWKNIIKWTSVFLVKVRSKQRSYQCRKVIPRVITPASVRGSDSYFIRVSNVGKGTFIRSRERWRRIYAVFSITQFVMAIIYIAPSNFRTHLHPLLHYIVSTWLTDLIAKNELVFLVYDIVLGVCRCVKLIETKHVWSLWLNILRSRRSFVSFHSSSR